MNDNEVLSQIDQLVSEEKALLQSGEERDLSATEHARLKELEVGLDQCWDLLRQRRAAREFGRDPEKAHVRDASTVERYKQ
jgi:hypothetical protein